MRFRDILGFAGESFKTRKVRTALTTLGIVIGIATIILLTGLSQSYDQNLTNTMEKTFPTRTMFVFPNSGPKITPIPLYQNESQNFEVIQHVTMAFPVIQYYGMVDFDNTWYYPILGVDLNKFGQVFPAFKAENGSLPASGEDQFVIGSRVHDPYGNVSTLLELNQNLTISWYDTSRTDSGFSSILENCSAPVGAILKEVGPSFNYWAMSDSDIYLPIATAARVFNTTRSNYFIVQLDNGDSATVDAAKPANSHPV